MIKKGTDLMYNKEKAKEILQSLNILIKHLYCIDEKDYIYKLFNTPTYIEKQIDNILNTIELSEIANKLEMIRCLLFEELFDWEEIENKLI